MGNKVTKCNNNPQSCVSAQTIASILTQFEREAKNMPFCMIEDDLKRLLNNVYGFGGDLKVAKDLKHMLQNHCNEYFIQYIRHGILHDNANIIKHTPYAHNKMIKPCSKSNCQISTWKSSQKLFQIFYLMHKGFVHLQFDADFKNTAKQLFNKHIEIEYKNYDENKVEQFQPNKQTNISDFIENTVDADIFRKLEDCINILSKSHLTDTHVTIRTGIQKLVDKLIINQNPESLYWLMILLSKCSLLQLDFTETIQNIRKRLTAKEKCSSFNRSKLRELNIIHEMSNVLGHPKLSSKLKKTMLLIIRGCLMENFRKQDIEFIATFLLHKVMNAKIVFYQHQKMKHTVAKQYPGVNFDKLFQATTDSHLIIEYMEICFVYIHNNLLSKKKAADKDVLIDTQFDKNFQSLCETMNIHWFAKFLHSSIGGNVSRA
eukprot:530892_1